MTDRDRGATLKVGGEGLISDSEWGGGTENTFAQKLFIIFKKVCVWEGRGGGGGAPHPRAL